MKNAKIVLVAEWDGWCGACAADRPLVLTRTGRLRLRTWLTGARDDSRPLLLTCRLCGTGVDVPLEADDPPVTVTTDVELEADAEAGEPARTVATAREDAVTAAPPAVAAQTPADLTAGLTAGREAVAQALAALVRQRSAVATVAPPAVVTQAPVVPPQRTASSGGLAELQLLADGIDLLSAGRS